MMVLKHARKARPGQPKRRLFHVLGGLVFPVAAFLVPRPVLLALVIATTLVALGFEVIRFLRPDLNGWLCSRFRALVREEEARRLTGSSYLLIATALTLLIFPRHIAATSLLFLALGDPLAGLVGERWGRMRLWGKSLEGTLACLLCCLAIGFVLAKAAFPLSLPSVLIGGLVAALADLLPLPVNDNLAIPLSAAAAMMLAGQL